MLTKNVLNPEKNTDGKIDGVHFFLFVSSNTQSSLFDQDMAAPIVWGTKDKVVVIAIDQLPKLCSAKSLNLQIYRWSGGKFTFKAASWLSNNSDDLKVFIRKHTS